jgi:MFS family permease
MAALANRGEGFLTLLRKKNFLRLWLAQLISMTIFNASNYALLILIQTLTHSTTLVGVAIISFSIPAIILGAPAGVLVDHMNKRRVLWASNCLRAIATFLFVIALLTARSLLLPIYLITFLISVISQFFTPAESSAIPKLVSEEELMPALSLFNITFMLSQALGYVILGPTMLTLLPTFSLVGITIDPAVQLYTVVALLYMVCALLILSIPHKNFEQTQFQPEKTAPLTTQTLGIISNVWSETKQGWSFVRGKKPLFLAVVQLSFAGVLIVVIGEIALPIVTNLLDMSINTVPFVFAPAGIGLVVGSVLMPRINRRLGRSRTVFVGAVALTLSTLLLPLITLLAHALQPNGWNQSPLLLVIVALIMFAAGVALDCINVPAQTAIQELTPEWIKGRVIGLQLVLYNACSIPVILSLGALSDHFGIDRVLYLMSAGELAFGFWGLYYERRHPQHFLASQQVEEAQNLSESDKITQGSSKLID